MAKTMQFTLTFAGTYPVEPADYGTDEPDEWIAQDHDLIRSGPILFLESIGTCDLTIDLQVAPEPIEKDEGA